MLLHTSIPAPHPSPRELPPPTVLLGESLAARRLRTQVQRIAPYLRTALVVGEPGTGKEQVARALHASGTQAEGPFVACSALTFAEALFEEGSSEKAASLLISARRGTLFLRDVDQLAYPLQGSLQRFLAQRESARLSGNGTRMAGAEVKIVAGSSRDLRTATSIGQFRAELYASLSVLEVRVPSLRERREDIAVMVDALVRSANQNSGTGHKTVSAAAMEQLETAEWPGNLRELEQAISYAAAHSPGGVIEAEHLPQPAAVADSSDVAAPAVGATGLADDRLESVVQRHVVQILTRCHGNKLRAAELLGISRSTLYRMLDAGAFASQLQRRGE